MLFQNDPCWDECYYTETNIKSKTNTLSKKHQINLTEIDHKSNIGSMNRRTPNEMKTKFCEHITIKIPTPHIQTYNVGGDKTKTECRKSTNFHRATKRRNPLQICHHKNKFHTAVHQKSHPHYGDRNHQSKWSSITLGKVEVEVFEADRWWWWNETKNYL